MRECVEEGILQSYFDGELSRKMAERVALHLASCAGCAQAASELESESLLLSEALKPEFTMSVPTERLRHRVDAAIAGLHAVNPARVSVVAKAAGRPAVPVVRSWAQSIAELFTLAPQRAFGYAGLAAVILFASVIGGIYWNHAGTKSSPVTVADNNIDSISPVVPIESTPEPSPVPQVVYQPSSTESPVSKRKPRPAPGPARAGIARVKLLPGERSYLKTIASLDATMKAESNRQMKPSMQVEYERNLAMVDQAIAATRSAAKVNPSDPDAADFMFAAYQSKIDLLNQVADSRFSNRQH